LENKSPLRENIYASNPAKVLLNEWSFKC